MRWKQTRVLVTGAGGFIGSHLTDHLVARGADVTALVNYNSRNDWGHLELYNGRLPANLNIVSGDVRDGAFVKRLVSGQGVVFHLAALISIPYSYISPQSFIDTNVRGTLNVLEACRESSVQKLIHTSTSEVFGTAKYVPIDERHPLDAQSPYAASKIAADQLVLSFHRSFGLPAVVFRPFNAFGPRQSARAVIPTILSGLIAGERKLSLGHLDPIRDFTFVTDTVEAFVLAAERAPAGEVINVGNGKGSSIRQIIEQCQRVLGKTDINVLKDRSRVRPTQSEVWRLICDNRKARKVLGWKPNVSLEKGLAVTAEYIQSQITHYKSGIYNV